MNEIKLHPLPGFVLAEPIPDDTMAGGVYIPETTRDKPAKAKVLLVGEPKPYGDTNRYLQDAGVKTGQIIIHKRWQPTNIKDNGKEILFINFDDILGYYE